ncbi:hypothetical protein CSUB01_04367 [Colletotrichum sublineola]|uniref:Uncharacterized protein n=1 Tax=Colletotrichum sublineola TaxID=1173701 RepID=A0A066XT32_COLSU|nr:hypothetical protein CSUB01_04367 [Colletotrichum sublineola]
MGAAVCSSARLDQRVAAGRGGETCLQVPVTKTDGMHFGHLEKAGQLGPTDRRQTRGGGFQAPNVPATSSSGPAVFVSEPSPSCDAVALETGLDGVV